MAIAPTTTSTPVMTAASAQNLSLTTASEQQDRFMKLLVAQMRNQDPLNPMDNAQMTSQVAQINTVAGIEKLNRTVESLVAATFGNLQAQAATQLPGRSVLVEGNRLMLEDGKAQGGVELDAAADSANVEILDGAGRVVQTIALGPLPAGVRSFTWDGLQSDGKPAADGAWSTRVMATAAGKPVTARTLTAAPVQAVTPGTAGLLIDLGSAGVQPWSSVKAFL